MRLVLALCALTCLAIFTIFIYPERCQLPVSMALQALSEIRDLTDGVNQYKNKTGHMPNALDELAPEVISRVPLDPWGRDYVFDMLNSSTFNIYSLGSDGVKGGSDGASDIDINTNASSLVQSISSPVFGCNL